MLALSCQSVWTEPFRPAPPQAMLAKLPVEARRLKAAGVGGIDFPAELCVIDERYASPQVWADAAAVLRAEGLGATVHLPSTWVDLAALDWEVREGSIRSVETALAATAPLGALMAVVHPTSYAAEAVVRGASPEARGAMLMRLGEALVCALARLRAGVGGAILALENLEGIPWFLFARLAEEAGVGVCLDVGHAVSNGDDPVAALADVSGRLIGLHLHDAVPGRAHLPLGSGRLDLGGLVASLRGMGFRGPVVLEVAGDPACSVKSFLDARAVV